MQCICGGVVEDIRVQASRERREPERSHCWFTVVPRPISWSFRNCNILFGVLVGGLVVGILDRLFGHLFSSFTSLQYTIAILRYFSVAICVLNGRGTDWYLVFKQFTWINFVINYLLTIISENIGCSSFLFKLLRWRWTHVSKESARKKNFRYKCFNKFIYSANGQFWTFVLVCTRNSFDCNLLFLLFLPERKPSQCFWNILEMYSHFTYIVYTGPSDTCVCTSGSWSYPIGDTNSLCRNKFW